MMREPGVDTRYIYATARIRVFETRLLGAGALERILEQETFADAVKVLGEAQDYVLAASSVRTAADVDGFFKRTLAGTYETARRLARDPGLIAPFVEKALLLEGARPGIGPSSVDGEIYGAFVRAWKGYRFLERYIRTAIDLENIRIFIRAKGLTWRREALEQAFIGNGYIPAGYFVHGMDLGTNEFFGSFEYRRYDRILREPLERYGRGEGLIHLEKACDDMLIDLIVPAKYFAFGAEPLVSYVLAKEFEVKNLRAILVGKANGFKEASIHEVLRKGYV